MKCKILNGINLLQLITYTSIIYNLQMEIQETYSVYTNCTSLYECTLYNQFRIHETQK